MDSSGNSQMRVLSAMFVIGAAANKLQPSTKFIWENIETGKKVLEFIGEIPEWGNYARNLENNLQSLKGRKEQLCGIKEDVKEEVEILEFQTNRKRKREVTNWLDNVERKAGDVDTIEEELQRKTCVSKFLFHAWLGKCVKKEEEEVDELVRQRVTLGSGSGLVIDANSGTVQLQLPASELVGGASSQKRLHIWTKLIKASIKTLGIVGEEGIGKRTLMANIYNLEIAKSGLFEHAFYLNVEGCRGTYQLQTAIGEEMKLQDLTNTRDEMRRAARIQAALRSRGKFLLILYGLSEHFRLHDIGIPVEDGGGKLVVVSRSEEICRRVCQEVIRVEKLPDEDSEELFMKTLQRSDPLSPDIEDVAELIIKKCGGVPLKIKNTAELLRGVDDICEWRTKLREM